MTNAIVTNYGYSYNCPYYHCIYGVMYCGVSSTYFTLLQKRRERRGSPKKEVQRHKLRESKQSRYVYR